MRNLFDLAVMTVILLIMVSAQTLAKFGALAPKNWVWGLNFFLVFSYFLYLIRGILWSVVLRRYELIRVYPWLSLSFPLVLLSGILLHGETLTIGKAVGTLFILSGTILISLEKT